MHVPTCGNIPQPLEFLNETKLTGLFKIFAYNDNNKIATNLLILTLWRLKASRILTKIAPSNGLMSDGTKPLLEQILNHRQIDPIEAYFINI